MRTANGLRSGLLACALVALAVGSPAATAPAEARDKPAAAAEKLLAQGQHEGALALAVDALRTDPESLDLLSVAARAAAGADRKDDGLWLAQRAVRLAEGRSPDHPGLPGLRELRETLDPLDAAQRADLDGYAEGILGLGRLAVERRYFVNAVQLLARLDGTRVAHHADQLLESIYRDEKAVAHLLDSSVPLPPTTTFARIRHKSAREEAKHTAWKKAWKLKSRNYTVLCNSGFDLTQRASTAMERINAFYRQVFDYKAKKRRSKTQHCQVRLFRSRDEYLTIGGAPERATAFYSPGEVAVVGYDPRSNGQPLSSLWSVLFHEASHQFTDLIAKAPVPSWLNEGTASYFEGTRMRVDGAIDTNLVPMERLASLVDALRTGRPTVHEVVSYDAPGSYPGEYYAVGWGLVYFLLNFEDDAGERVYDPHYREFMDTYRQGETKPGAFERFVQHFVTNPAQPGIETFDQFTERFADWIYALNGLHAGPPDRAREFLEIARRHRERGHVDRAEASCRNALTKEPANIAVLLLLSEICHESGRKDEAIARLREIVEQIGRAGDYSPGFVDAGFETAQDAAEEAATRLAAMDSAFGERLAGFDAEFDAKVEAAADAYREAGYPRTAVGVITAALTLLGDHHDLDLERQQIWEQAALSILTWRDVPVDDDLTDWRVTPEWKVKDTSLEVSVGARKLRAALFLSELPPRYRFEALLTRSRLGDGGSYGLLFGADPDGAWDLVGPAGEWIEVARVFQTFESVASPYGLSPEQFEQQRLAVEVRPGTAQFFLDGVLCGEQQYAPGDLRGGVGVYASDADVRFSEMRISY